MNPSLGADFLLSIRREFESCRKLAEGAFSQLAPAEFSWRPDPESNSVAVIMRHLGGNLLSRWTDFLTTDGEKPWRKRDEEFEEAGAGIEELRGLWARGWECLFAAIDSMSEETLGRTIQIRGAPHTVTEALHRGLGHTAYHVGQIVFISKAIRSGKWKTLSIPRGKSGQYTPGPGGR
jgi:hypothetical protein